jgi:hypothetical protein
MARTLGIRAKLGRAFQCVIHSDTSPSAALHRMATGCWSYHDFHFHQYGTPEWLTLAQVRALRAGRQLPLSGPEHATWKLILLCEAGVLDPLPVAADPLPDGISGLTRHVYERLLFLLGCRWHYSYGAPVPFDCKFAAALCEVPVRSAREAIDELNEIEAIHVVGKQNRTRLWLPAGVAE